MAEPMKLNDEKKKVDAKKKADASEENAGQQEAVRQGDQHRPYCRRHNCLMVSSGTKEKVTRYRCPVKDCSATEKRAQPRSAIPRRPLECPHCRGRAAAEKENRPPVFCVVDYHRSTQGTLLMACPTDGCQFEVRVPRPDVAARSRRLHAREEEAPAR